MPKEKLISEAIQPVALTFDTSRMAAGEPGLPKEFEWKGERFRIEKVLRTWKDTGPCRHGSGERYVRKHWFEVVTTAGRTMRIYFERTPRRGGGGNAERWRLFSATD